MERSAVDQCWVYFNQSHLCKCDRFRTVTNGRWYGVMSVQGTHPVMEMASRHRSFLLSFVCFHCERFAGRKHEGQGNP